MHGGGPTGPETMKDLAHLAHEPDLGAFSSSAIWLIWLMSQISELEKALAHLAQEPEPGARKDLAHLAHLAHEPDLGPWAPKSGSCGSSGSSGSSNLIVAAPPPRKVLLCLKII